MKRLGIYLVYDAYGKMDDYIEYMLVEAKKVMDDIVVVCNGRLVPDGRKLLEKYAKQIIVRENRGYDFGAWKDAMMDYIGFPVIKQYDELILFNDSFFGPFDGFETVFDKMESRELDFWGLTVHGEVETVKNMNPYGYRPRYIQTYFVVFNKRIINDFSFFNYWKDLPYFKTFLEAGEKGSAVLTKYFEDLGFSWGVYTDTTEYETTREKNVCNHAFNTLDIIKNKEYPIIKRKSFVLGKQRFLKYNSGLDLEKAVSYIEKEKDYDMNLIYKHIIRRFNIQELKESMNLDFVLSSNQGCISLADYRVLVCVQIKSLNYLAQIATYVNAIDAEISIVLFVDDEICEDELRKYIKRDFVLRSGVHNSADMLEDTIIFDYDFICFISHSTKFDNDIFTIKNSYTEVRWENCVISNDYIANVIQTFMSRDYLGVLIPEQSVHGTTYADGHKGKQNTIERYQTIFEALGMECQVDENVEPVYCDGAFWCRKEAISKLIDRQYDFSKLEDVAETKETIMELIPYFAQENGYFTGACMTDRFAATLIESMKYMEKEIYYSFCNSQHQNFVDFFSYRSEVKKILAKLKENEIVREVIKEVPVEVIKEVPVLVDIGVKGALKNWLNKKFGRKKNND